jgi:hypothetical protein
METGTLSVAGLFACMEQLPTLPIGSVEFTSDRCYFSQGQVLENANMVLDLARAEELLLNLCKAYIGHSNMFSVIRAETHGPHFVYYLGYELKRIAERGMGFLPGVRPPNI